MSKEKSSLCWVWLSGIVILIDQATKWFASQTLTLGQSHPVLPFFNLTLAHNTGAAFSFLDQESGWQAWLFGGIALVVSAIILAWLWRLPRKYSWQGSALALILGGALGNFYDRIAHGYVIDFLDFYIHHWHWPAFNIADSAICIGAVMLVLDVFRR